MCLAPRVVKACIWWNMDYSPEADELFSNDVVVFCARVIIVCRDDQELSLNCLSSGVF
jgi:hypothetical protein